MPLLVYRLARAVRIPLYLFSKDTAAALAELMSEHPGKRYLDLGAGIGSVLRRLASALPGAQLTGFENAPANRLAGYLRTAGLPNCKWRWGGTSGEPASRSTMSSTLFSPRPRCQHDGKRSSLRCPREA